MGQIRMNRLLGFTMTAICLVVGCQQKPPVKEAKVQKSYFNEKIRCSELAKTWSVGMKPGLVGERFVMNLVDYSPKRQSCVVFFQLENSAVTTYFVQDILTESWYYNEYCSENTQKKCGQVTTEARAVFDDLVKMD